MNLFILEHVKDPGYDCGLDSNILGVYSTLELAHNAQANLMAVDSDHERYTILEYTLDDTRN